MDGEGGPLTPAHLLAKTLDQVAEINNKLGTLNTQLEVHLATHRVITKVHRSAYAALTAVIGSLTGLLASHWK